MAKKNTVPTNAAPRAAVPFISSEKKPSFWKLNRNVAMLFFVLGFTLYGYSLFSDYVLDDQIVITDNRFTKKGTAGIGDILKKESFVGYFGEQRDLVAGARYRPLSLVTFAMEWSMFAPDETKLPKLAAGQKRDYNGAEFKTVRFVHHFTNILLYCLSAILLYRILLILFPLKEDEKWYFNLPFVASLLFLLHPIHTEAVANIKGRDEIMAFLAAFGTLYYVLKYAETGRFVKMIQASIVFFLGLLSKENTLTFLAIVPLTLYCFKDFDVKKSLQTAVPLLVTTILYLIIRVSVIGYLLGNGKEITDIMNNPFYGVPMSERFATIFYTLWRYIQLLFYPHPLTHDYYPYQIPIVNWSNLQSIAALILYTSLGVYGVWSVWKKKSIIGYAILFYLITFSIVSNIPFSIGTFMNDRFIYLSSVGFSIIVAYWITDFLPKKNLTTVGMALLGILSLGYSVKTMLRIPDWKDTLSLNTSAINISPNSARANLFYGVALFNEAQKVAGDERKNFMYKALPYAEKAVEILPSYGSAIHMLSGIDAEIYQYDKDVDKILAKYEKYLHHRESLSIEDIPTNSTFIDKYLKYLCGQPEYKDKMLVFYKKIIPIFLEEKKDGKNAVRYASEALALAPGELEISALMSKAQMLNNQQGKK